MIFETTLPGSSIQVIDEYNTSVYDTSEFGTTESVLVIGTAFDGPTGKEVMIYNPEHAAYIFGGTYDSVAKRSADLVAQIQDVYDKGCRTIYAIRVGGKELSKTYRLKEDLPVYFKISSVFPSNKYKDMALAIHDGKFEIFKTANKTTLEEKREGVIESVESIVKVGFNINDKTGGGFNADSKLVDFLEFVNNYTKNNVFHFSLVNEQGLDITTGFEAQNISLGALFDGVYTIGRIDNEVREEPVIKADFADAPYKGFNGDFIFKIETNKKVESLYPIIISDYESLNIFGKLDDYSKKDDVDYEEVDMSKFELYKKLGSGYAQTAKLEEYTRDSNKITVKPTDHVVEIGEGIYSTASSLKTDYRILASAYADDTIIAQLPKPEDFLRVSKNEIPLLFGKNPESPQSTTESAVAIYKLDNDVEKKYAFKVVFEEDIEVVTVETLKTSLEKTTAIKPLKDTTDISPEKHVITTCENEFWITTKEEEMFSLSRTEKAGAKIKTIMPLSALNDENKKTCLVTVEEEKGLGGELDTVTYTIHIAQGYAEISTVNDIAELLKNTVIGKTFDIKCTHCNYQIAEKSEAEAKANKSIEKEKGIEIPYITTDNFARQFAQHCEYTSLKTYQTHGVIGVKPILDTSINSVTAKYNSLIERDYQMYVKNTIGKEVRDMNNLPYNIGKAITITTMQHTINTLDGYRYTASGQGTYVGRASVLSREVSTTNQVLPITPHFTYSETQKTGLNRKGYVTVSYRDGAYKVTDGVTQAPIYSQFSRFATFRTMKMVDQVIREATEPFIGKKNNLINRNAMYTAIKSGMDALLEIYLERYEFTMNYNKHDARLGEIKISYEIDILDEIRNVKNTVTAKK